MQCGPTWEGKLGGEEFFPVRMLTEDNGNAAVWGVGSSENSSNTPPPPSEGVRFGVPNTETLPLPKSTEKHSSSCSGCFLGSGLGVWQDSDA